MRSINFENIIRKHFGSVNREGLGFLESDIKALAAELNSLTTEYEKVLTLRDSDLKPRMVVVQMAIEDHEVSFDNLSISDFIVNKKKFYEAAIVVYSGRLGKNVLKYAPRNITIPVALSDAEEDELIQLSEKLDHPGRPDPMLQKRFEELSTRKRKFLNSQGI